MRGGGGGGFSGIMCQREHKLLAMREKSLDMSNGKDIFTHFDTTERYRH